MKPHACRKKKYDNQRDAEKAMHGLNKKNIEGYIFVTYVTHITSHPRQELFLIHLEAKYPRKK